MAEVLIGKLVATNYTVDNKTTAEPFALPTAGKLRVQCVEQDLYMAHSAGDTAYPGTHLLVLAGHHYDTACASGRDTLSATSTNVPDFTVLVFGVAE